MLNFCHVLRDGINITLKIKDFQEYTYPAHQMSDGEKAILYYIAQVLQAPEDGFIIVDEPEMYLHKTLVQKLWDCLERERHDCIFIYLTHDLDFAISRTTAKKTWIKSFTHPNTWDIEEIPDNEIPKPLILELLGSRKDILFCEGKKDSIDVKIYNILFPEYTITPVESCSSVINYTKAFNLLPNVNIKAYGIIDSDHHGIERIESMKKQNIFPLSVAESENLFFDEYFLSILAKRLLIDKCFDISSMKQEVINQLNKDVELQVSNYVSSKINYHFKESHVDKGNTLNEIEDNFKMFNDKVKIKQWFDERNIELNEIIKKKDYTKAISIYNNKGLHKIANKYFKISDFTERAINLIQRDYSTHEILLKYFPIELKDNIKRIRAGSDELLERAVEII